jgi:hypothetical protein
MGLRSVSKQLRASEKPATKDNGSFARQTVGAAARSQSSDGGPRAVAAYRQLRHLADETRREIRSARLEYPPDQVRIDRLGQTLGRLLVTLLLYERPKLEPVAAPSEPHLTPEEQADMMLKVCSAEELAVLVRIGQKLNATEGAENEARAAASIADPAVFNPSKPASQRKGKSRTSADAQRSEIRRPAMQRRLYPPSRDHGGSPRGPGHAFKSQMTSAEFNAELRNAGFGVAKGRIVDVSGKCPGFSAKPTFQSNGLLDRYATLTKVIQERGNEMARRAGGT